MNLIALLAGLLPWAATPVSAFTRIYLACSLLSLEVQIVTWTGRGTLGGLVPLNIALALIMIGWHIRRKRTAWQWLGRTRQLLPTPILITAFAVVAALNLWRPVEAADPYQLDRVLHIERVGTLAYSASLDPKANFLGGLYELLLADLHGVPGIGPTLVRLHGIWGLGLYSLSLAAAQSWLPVGPSVWASAILLLVPAVFNQLVLIKNDLFIGAPALVALAWAVGSAGQSNLGQIYWAGWMVGLAVAGKATNGAVALVTAAAVLTRERAWKPLLGVVVGILSGLLAGGLALVLWQNVAFYGDPLATREVAAIGSVNSNAREMVVGLTRFVVSWFDLGLVTRSLWPGRGGWGGTLGLPFIWSLAVLLACCRSRPEARRALLAGAACLFALGVTFPDADLSHRLVLGPGLMMIVAGASVSRGLEARWVSQSLIAAVVLSTVQLLRSALLYALSV